MLWSRVRLRWLVGAVAGVLLASAVVITGIRPEQFEDAAGRPDADNGVRYTGMVDVVESVGSDVYTYLTLDGGRATAAEFDELARDAGVDIGTETEIVARLDAGTRAREGERLAIRFDPAAVAVFDPRTGDRLYAGGNVPGRS